MQLDRTLAEWLAYLETLHIKTIDLELIRVKAVADQMQLWPVPYFVITVAGTNGKGTSVALLESIFLAAGYRVGSYTSPHLLHYNERVKIQGKPVTDADLCAAFTVIEQARNKISLTYFEFGTLAALWLFQQQPLDVVILEVGLGGRLDAVNIVDADIALITTIALDHMEYLGDNRESIAKEKSGIMRAHKPVVCGDFAVPETIYTCAQQVRAPLFVYGKDFFYQSINHARWEWRNAAQHWDHLPIPNIPLQNAAAVLQVLTLLPTSFHINRENIITGLRQVCVAGRFQLLSGDVQCVLDVAHNPAAAAWLAEKLKASSIKGRILAVIGMLEDKDHLGTVRPLMELVSVWFVGGLAVSRGMPAAKLTEKLNTAGGKNIKSFVTVKSAYENARQNAQADDLIVVFGSFYTVAEALRLGDKIIR